MTKDRSNKNIEIEINDETAEGVYSNLAVISHSTSDFVLDFIRVVPNAPKAKVKSRVIMSPENAKRLIMALQDNIRGYESTHGSIKLRGERPSNEDMMPSYGINLSDPIADA